MHDISNPKCAVHILSTFKMNEVPLSVLFCLLFTLVWALPSSRIDQADQPEDEVGIYGDHFQGDMILTEEQISALFSTTLSGQVSTKYRWPNGIVSYVIESKYTEKERKKLLDAMKDIESVSCIKFVERTTEKDYIEIVRGNGCGSHVGRQGKRQGLSLGNGCLSRKTIQHEILHALGFHHMQSADDRDEYITILWDNIQDKYKFNYKKYTSSHFGASYDYLSIMHYNAYGFAKDKKKPTMMPHDESMLNRLGSSPQMTSKDILRLNNMYECEKLPSEKLK